jgi:hypothetical protein
MVAVLKDTSSPSRMWTLARVAAEAREPNGWHVEVGRIAGDWVLSATIYDGAAGSDWQVNAVWTFWHDTTPAGPGSWRIGSCVIQELRGRATRKRRPVLLRDLPAVLANGGLDGGPL